MTRRRPTPKAAAPRRRCMRRYGSCSLERGHRGAHDAYSKDITWCAARHPLGDKCELVDGHTGDHDGEGEEGEDRRWPSTIMSPTSRTSEPFRGSDEVEALVARAAEDREQRWHADWIVQWTIDKSASLHGIRGDVLIEALEAAAERLRAEARARKAGR